MTTEPILATSSNHEFHDSDSESDVGLDEDNAKLLQDDDQRPRGRERSHARSIEAETEPNWKVVRDIVLEVRR